MRRAVVVAMVGCGTPAAPTPITNVPPPVVADAAVAPVDLGAELQAIARARVPAPVAEVDPGIDPPPLKVELLPAFGPCTRPDEAEQTTLRARVEAWVRAQYPDEGFDPEGVVAVGFGCVEPAGVIVDLTVNTWRKRERRSQAGAPPGFTVSTPPSRGRWLTVRVTATTITTVIETHGIPSFHGGEWAWKTTQTTLALADLDRDGASDVISVKEQWDVGNLHHHLDLTTVLATGARATFGTFGDYIELAPQPREANRAVVVRIKDDRIDRVILRCIDGSATLATSCPELAAAQRRVDAELAAAALATGPARTDLDRDEVTALVELFEVPEPRRAALIAAAPVKPSRVIAREVERWARTERGEDVLLLHEREAIRIAEEDRQSAAAFQALGDAACAPGASTPALDAKIAAWVAANDRRLITTALRTDASLAEQCKATRCVTDRPTRPTITMACTAGPKHYAIATWHSPWRDNRPGVWRTVLLFVEGARIRHVFDAVEIEPMCCSHDYRLSIDAQFYRRGDALIATVLEGGPDQRTVVVAGDGVIGDRRTGSLARYPIRPLLVDTAAGSIWHAVPALQQVTALDLVAVDSKPQNPLEALIFEREIRGQARQSLAQVTESSDGTVAALVILGAPKELIERVRAAR